MSDFIPWLYANYIKPQLDRSRTIDSIRLYDSVCCALEEDGLGDLDRILEFTAIQAFLLGMRTGEGIARAQ